MPRRRPSPLLPPHFDPAIAVFLERVHSACSGRERLRRDPLAIVVRYPDPCDREIAALVASTLAFGRVDLIMGAVERALAPLGEPGTPIAQALDALHARGEPDFVGVWAGFRYRFCSDLDMAALMRSIAAARRTHGSLEAFFAAGDRGRPASLDIVPAATAFVDSLRDLGADPRTGRSIRPNLLPSPRDGSACKRLFLFLRWMVRSDGVDPGGWTCVSPARLVVPLDVHMFRTCRDRLGFFGPASLPGAVPKPGAPSGGLRGDAPSLAHALAATAAFRLYAPDDPVKYDFALTRPGIDPEPGDEAFACL